MKVWNVYRRVFANAWQIPCKTKIGHAIIIKVWVQTFLDPEGRGRGEVYCAGSKTVDFLALGKGKGFYD